MNPVSAPIADEAPRAVTLRAQSDVAVARQAAAQAMTAAGASAIGRTRFVTAVSEVARNAILHGGGGVVRFARREGPQGASIMAECRDRGPGIEDVGRALSDGYSSKRGLGLGLGGARRLVDLFEITTAPGQGTMVRLTSRAR